MTPEQQAYADALTVEIAADAAKQSWTVDQWISFYDETETGPWDYTLDRKGLFGLVGVAKGEAVVASIKTTSPELANQLRVSEGGANINHPDFATVAADLVTGGVITQAESDQVASLATKTGPRYVVRGLPLNREAYLIPAVASVQ